MNGSSRRTRAGCRVESPLRVGAVGLLLAALLLVAPVAAQAMRLGGSSSSKDHDRLHRVLLRDRGARHDLHSQLLESLKGHREEHHFGRHFDAPDSIDDPMRRKLDRRGWKLKHSDRRHFRRMRHHHHHHGGGHENPTVVPEPSTLLLLAGGFGALAAGRRRRR